MFNRAAWTISIAIIGALLVAPLLQFANRLDFWIMVAILATMLFLKIRDILVWIQQWLQSIYMSSIPSSFNQFSTFDNLQKVVQTAANERTNELRTDGLEASESRTEERASSFALSLTNEQAEAVRKMIVHRVSAESPTKTTTIQAGFGVSRGEGATYKRASEIYDVLFAEPRNKAPSYQALDESCRPVLKQG